MESPYYISCSFSSSPKPALCSAPYGNKASLRVLIVRLASSCSSTSESDTLPSKTYASAFTFSFVDFWGPRRSPRGCHLDSQSTDLTMMYALWSTPPSSDTTASTWPPSLRRTVGGLTAAALSASNCPLWGSWTPIGARRRGHSTTSRLKS